MSTTKAQELTQLNQFIHQLEPGSYLREWLVQVTPEVESMIRSDFIPSVLLKDSARQCSDLLRDAKLQADRILAQAEEQRVRIARDAQRAIERARDAMHVSTRALDDY